VELKVVFEPEIKFRVLSRCARLVAGAWVLGAGLVSAQSSPPQPMPAGTPELRRADARATAASAEDLERRADQLRAAKDYFEAVNYYRGALSQKPNSAVLYNKLGINELLSARYPQAQKDFERATKLDAGYADAFNNLGVLEYVRRRYSRAIKLRRTSPRRSGTGPSRRMAGR
jgi:tetratricopeptide (TPR) repeat protein